MEYETALEIGVDLIAPACTIFTVWYFFRPWHQTHIGRAIMAHSAGSMVLFDVAMLTQYEVIPMVYPYQEEVTIGIVILWIVGWWYMVFGLWLSRPQTD